MTLACIIYHNGDYYVYQPISLVQGASLNDSKWVDNLDIIAKSHKLAWTICKGETEDNSNNEFVAGEFIPILFIEEWSKLIIVNDS